MPLKQSSLAIQVLLLAFQVAASANLLEQPVRVRLMTGEDAITLRAAQTIQFGPEGAKVDLDPGTYTLTASQVKPAHQQFHLFAKTFSLKRSAEQDAYLAQMKQEGFEPLVRTIGRIFEVESGRVLDTRVNWVSIRQTDSRKAAQAARTELIANGQPVWIQAETMRQGRGFIQVNAPNGTIMASFAAPLIIESTAPIEIEGVDTGFWDENRDHLSYTGSLLLRIGPDGRLEVIEILPIEDYLRGVLPAEMPSTWHLEALKAQAVAARSDVVAGLGTRHSLEGFDFLGNEQSRAYLGAGGYKPTTDEALEQTAGQILLDGDRIVPTVFSATCGGWTENNDTVWYGPPDSALRGVSGLTSAADSHPLPIDSIRNWVQSYPDAYCSHDKTYFRWKRTYSERELRDIINARYPIGRIESIELGERGVSGRLKWLRVVGSHGTETIHKELPIRLAFDGLPSAMFILDTEIGPNGEKTYVLQGGGRGHGVGLCQHGAQGMALSGLAHEAILKRYFSGVEVVRCP